MKHVNTFKVIYLSKLPTYYTDCLKISGIMNFWDQNSKFNFNLSFGYFNY